jgi:hypothetical protein
MGSQNKHPFAPPQALGSRTTRSLGINELSVLILQIQKKKIPKISILNEMKKRKTTLQSDL